MKRSWILWIISFLLTLASAVYQRLTGPTHPIRGTSLVGDARVRYRLERSHGGPADHPVRIEVPNTGVTGTVFWKRHKMDDPWVAVPMARQEGALVAVLPHQPPAGKLDYRVVLKRAGASVTLPPEGATVIRFKGGVPLPVLVVHVIAMFSAMLVSTRAGLEALAGGGKIASLTKWTAALLFAGGLILGPVVQKYAFDAFWTGWPFGTDLTDNKTVVAFLAWLGVWATLGRTASPRRWVIGAALATLVVFLIPHSLLGSEFDYSKLPVKQ